MNKLFLDIETTGLDINNTAVIEVGYLVVDSKFNVINERSYLIKPEGIHTPYVWTEQAEGCHKITELEALQHTYTHETFCKQFVEDIKEDFGDKYPTIYGFNVGFDFWMMKRMFNKHDIEMPIYYSLGDISSMASILLGKDACSSRVMATMLGVSVDEDKAHRAIYDCKLALACYKGLRGLGLPAHLDKMRELSNGYKKLMAGSPDKEEVFDYMSKFFNAL